LPAFKFYNRPGPLQGVIIDLLPGISVSVFVDKPAENLEITTADVHYRQTWPSGQRYGEGYGPRSMGAWAIKAILVMWLSAVLLTLTHNIGERLMRLASLNMAKRATTGIFTLSTSAAGTLQPEEPGIANKTASKVTSKAHAPIPSTQADAP